MGKWPFLENLSSRQLGEYSPWGLDWGWIATTWRSERRSLASLLTGNAASRVPGLDHDVVGWVSEADDDELGYVGAEEV